MHLRQAMAALPEMHGVLRSGDLIALENTDLGAKLVSPPLHSVLRLHEFTHHVMEPAEAIRTWGATRGNYCSKVSESRSRGSRRTGRQNTGIFPNLVYVEQERGSTTPPLLPARVMYARIYQLCRARLIDRRSGPSAAGPRPRSQRTRLTDKNFSIAIAMPTSENL